MAKLFRGKKWNRRARIIDPACGEGVFLHVAIEGGHAPDRCWGIDIDESLVQAWKADKRLHGAHLSIANGLLDNTSNRALAGSFDLVIGNPPFAGQGLKDLLKLVQPKTGKALRERSLFDDFADDSADENSSLAALPPHERASLDDLVRQLNRYVCWRLRDESEDDNESSPNTPSGHLFNGLNTRPSSRTSDFESMAGDVAACPDDRLLDARRPAVRNVIRRIAGTAIEVFFTERFVKLAKPGGTIAVIVPESILASDQLNPFRKWLMEEMQLLAVVGLPQKVFTGVGAKAKTGIIFARRYTEAEQQRINSSGQIRTQRRSSELTNKKVIMVAPDTAAENWTLNSYLTAVLERSALDQNHKQRLGAKSED